ncbi:N-acetylglucosaminylphosphatidylinositol deacetylase [Nematocida displodere]|uniref:N-acetylglucosaminylphosphatidylinositol deacetylase n=1 Tax=Nematocida displodere TaxID=1805483 RepID=A0A177EE80_9MICR|nr:N-acetylglucosaminylphosphatidylinositol deacetylase [Nematocida displodere]
MDRCWAVGGVFRGFEGFRGFRGFEGFRGFREFGGVVVWIVVIWAVVRVGSFIVGRDTFSGTHSKTEKYMMIIAHPDDESMFFGPFLSCAARRKSGVVVVVLTDGAGGGDRATRQKEMEKLCRDEGIELFSLGERDGYLKTTQELIDQLIVIFKLTQSGKVVTFDKKGVSRHTDHTECFYIAKTLATQLKQPTFLALQTFSLFGKYFAYFPPLSQALCPGQARHCTRGSYAPLTIKNTLKDSLSCRKRMLYHKSQLLWFRYCYILLSTYMDVNVLEEVRSDVWSD